MRILVVEDDIKLAKMVRMALIEVGDVTLAGSGEEALRELNNQYYDLVILDLMLPGINGIEVLKEIRKKYVMSIIVLSAISEVDKKVLCLNNGADDYIEKPFSRDEFLARVQASLRRSNKGFEAFEYKFKNLVVNYNNKMVFINGDLIDINRKTYEILELVVRNKELIMTKQQVFDRIWGFNSDVVQTVVDVNIFRLRKILSQYGLQDHLVTIKSTGYMWTEKIK